MAGSSTTRRTSSRSRRDRSAHRPLRPFTVDHWRAWTRQLILDSGDPWVTQDFQDEFAADLFSGITEIWLVVPEGNTKTTTLSGVALYYADFRADASILMAASSRDQCGLMLNQGIGFVERSPAIRQRYRTYEGYRRIDAVLSGSRIQVFAADDRTGDGVIPDLALLDELHRHRTLRLHNTWLGKMDKRDGQMAVISTAGEPGSEFETVREQIRTESPDITVKGRHIRAAGPDFILHDFALRPDDDPRDLSLVKQANPFSGITIPKLERKLAGPTMTLGHWRRFVCNMPTRTEAAAVGEGEWLVAGVDDPGVKGMSCDAGLDLGWKWDATAIQPLFKIEDDGDQDGYWLLGVPRVIIPPRDGNSLDPERVMREFEDLHAVNPIQRVVMDPSAGGEQLHFWLEKELGVEVVSYSQKPEPMSLAAERFLEALREGLLKHLRDPVLTRHVLNAVARELADGKVRFDRPVRSRSNPEAPRREIDALIASAIVTAVAIAAAAAPVIDLADFRITRL